MCCIFDDAEISIMNVYPYIKSVVVAVSLTGWGLHAQILTDFVGDWTGVENLHSPTTFYENKSIKKIKPLKLIVKEDLYYLHTQGKTFEYKKITKLQILKERF